MPIPVSNAAIDRSLLRDDVFRRLRDAITDGTLAPGEQLRDLELAAWLGVSRTPVSGPGEMVAVIGACAPGCALTPLPSNGVSSGKGREVKPDCSGRDWR